MHLPALVRGDLAVVIEVHAVEMLERRRLGLRQAHAAVLVRVGHAAKKFRSDPSQITRPSWCRGRGGWFVNPALHQLPREAFDYLWMIDPPPFDPKYVAGLQPVWRNGSSVLYRLH